MSDVIDVTNSSVPAISDDTLVSLAEQAEKRVEALNKIKRAALKATNARDWTDQNGNPYLQVSGAEKVGRVFGLSWRIGEPTLEFEEGGHFRYTYKGEFSLAGATIEVIGTRSSKDGFFKRYSGKGENRVELPPSEIDKGDVQKAALTNLLGNGITRLLGLRNLTWDDLKEIAGIDKDTVSAVNYKKNGGTRENIASEGSQTVSFIPEEVKKSTFTKKDKTEGTKYHVKDVNGVSYDTFSKTLAELASDAKVKCQKVKVVFKESKFGKDIESMTLEEAA